MERVRPRRRIALHDAELELILDVLTGMLDTYEDDDQDESSRAYADLKARIVLFIENGKRKTTDAEEKTA